MRLLKLIDFSAEEIAEEAQAIAMRDFARLASALGVSTDTPRETPVYGAAHAVAVYALTGERRRNYIANRNRLIRWLGEAAVVQAEPDSPLPLAVAVAEAREAIHADAPLTSMQLAHLSGVDRDRINVMASTLPHAFRSDENRHRPWRFRPMPSLLLWIETQSKAVFRLC